MYVERRKERRDNVWMLYKEYHSHEMAIDRRNTSALLRNKPAETTYTQLKIAFEGQRQVEQYGVTDEEWESLIRLFNFFAQLHTYKTYGYLDEKLAERIFGGYFCGWYHDRLKDLLDISQPERPQDALHYHKIRMRELAGWLDDYCSKG
jgi:hypothetical protein